MGFFVYVYIFLYFCLKFFWKEVGGGEGGRGKN